MRSRRFKAEASQGRAEAYGGRPRLAAASLALIGLLIGGGLGLAYAWIVDPINYVAANPARLSAEAKEEYILLVSQSLAAVGDWEQARQRLNALEDPRLTATVTELLERSLRAGRPADMLRNLAYLAERLGVEGQAVAIFQPPPAGGRPSPTAEATEATPAPPPTPRPSRSPTASPAPSPSSTPAPQPSPTVEPVYRLLSQQPLCLPTGPAGRIEVVVLDGLLEPVPGIEVRIAWEGGSDRFYTGFQPERGPGYGDFAMQPEVSYSAWLAAGSPVISGLRLETCSQDLGGFAGGWHLTFQSTAGDEPAPTPAG
ncbi:MAG: hypothetical protein ACRDHL_12650 [Candidatus Promineifilaceae bacterium]